MRNQRCRAVWRRMHEQMRFLTGIEMRATALVREGRLIKTLLNSDACMCFVHHITQDNLSAFKKENCAEVFTDSTTLYILSSLEAF